MTGSSRAASLAVLAVGALLLGGCTTLGYYAQSVRGQLGLLYRAEPIDRLLADPNTPPPLAGRLQRVGDMLEFAAGELELPHGGSYRDYVDVGSEALVWTVVATEAFSLEPRQWCFPVIGCTSYRGYFGRGDAQRYAGRLRDEGLDVAVERVPAYSTLGWFDDPLPSTVIDWPEYQLAGLIFHELAHQRLYLAGDSAFNEGYATLVEEEGVERWLARHGDPGARRRYRASQARQADFLALLAATRTRLQSLYAGPGGAAEKRAAKAAVLDGLRADYRQVRRCWDGYAGYDEWFDRPLNNAHLAAIATYRDRVPAFERLLHEVQGDLGRFHAAAEALAALPAATRERELDRLAGQAAPTAASAGRLSRCDAVR